MQARPANRDTRGWIADATRYRVMREMRTKQSLGRAFLELSALNAYGIWLILVLFPLVLAGMVSLIDERRSPGVLMLASIAIGIIAASYIIRFYLVRNTKTLRTEVLEADSREKALNIISGGLWWWLITLICAITAAVFGRNMF